MKKQMWAGRKCFMILWYLAGSLTTKKNMTEKGKVQFNKQAM